MKWRRKIMFCKLYMEDFWGILLRKARKSRVLKIKESWKNVRYMRWSKQNNFVQKRDKEFNLRIKKVMHKQRLGGPLRAKYKLKRYYGGMSQVEYSRILKKAKKLKRTDRLYKKRQRGLIEALVGLLEKRLESLVFRMNLVTSIEEAQAYIKMGYFTVNGNIITKTRYVLSVGDVISVRKENYEKLMAKLKERLDYKGVIVNYPRYLEVHYGILSGILLKEPEIDEIPYLGKMEVEGVSGTLV